jgi:MFS family permease
MAAGLTNSAFFAMMPAVCTRIGMSHAQLAGIMSATVFAGLTAQWAVGAVSDRFDRTLVLIVIAAAIAVVSGWLFVGQETAYPLLVGKMGLLGALVFAVYPVSVARAHDVFDGQDTVAVSGCLLFAYSVGACASPLLASGLMTLLKSPFGLFAFWFIVNAGLALVSIYLLKKEKVEVVAVEDQVAFVPMKRSSPVVIAMDPRNGPQGGNPSVAKGDVGFPRPAADAGQER